MATLSRPDIAIYSVSKKRLIWFENNVPLEMNIIYANLRKIRGYANLETNLKLKRWTDHDFGNGYRGIRVHSEIN